MLVYYQDALFPVLKAFNTEDELSSSSDQMTIRLLIIVQKVVCDLRFLLYKLPARCVSGTIPFPCTHMSYPPLYLLDLFINKPILGFDL